MSSVLPQPSNPPSRASIEAWLREVVSELAVIPVASVDVHTPLSRFGVDSATALIVTDMLIEWLSIDLDPTLLYDYETIDALASYLEGCMRERTAQGVST